MVNNPTMKGTELRKSLERDSGLKVSYTVASRLKQASTRANEEQLKRGYSILEAYCRDLVQGCPGSVAVVQVRRGQQKFRIHPR
ncbi:unnamed protein product [Hapterophycus canaliculatus]